MTSFLRLTAFAMLFISAYAIPAGFTRTKVSTTTFQGNSGANIPTKLRFLPDGRVMYSTRVGSFYVSPNTTPLAPTLLFTVNNVNSQGELG